MMRAVIARWMRYVERRPAANQPAAGPENGAVTLEEGLSRLQVGVGVRHAGRLTEVELRRLVTVVACSARDAAVPPERLLILLKRALHGQTAPLDGRIEERWDITERMISLAIDVYFSDDGRQAS